MLEAPQYIPIDGYGSLTNYAAGLIINKLHGYLVRHPNYNQAYCGDTDSDEVIDRFLNEFGNQKANIGPQVYPSCVLGNSLNLLFIKYYIYRPFELGTTTRITFTTNDFERLESLKKRFPG